MLVSYQLGQILMQTTAATQFDFDNPALTHPRRCSLYLIPVQSWTTIITATMQLDWLFEHSLICNTRKH